MKGPRQGFILRDALKQALDTRTLWAQAFGQRGEKGSPMYKVYGDYKSGNCYKVKLMLTLLGIPYEWIDIDILKGDTQTLSSWPRTPMARSRY